MKKLMLLSLILLLLLWSFKPRAQVLESDSLALVALYNATDGLNWTNNSNWLSGPVGKWFGVSLNESKVISLRLGSNQLTGTIPPELGNLSELRTLLLFDNMLSGGIPEELGNLFNLQVLSVGINELKGEIPASLGNLLELQILFLEDNKLEGRIPRELGSLPDLIDLRMYENKLGGRIPPELGNLMNLEILNLRGNTLNGEIPSELGNLSRLRELSLDDNEFNGAIPGQIGNLSKLETLVLRNNALSDEIPVEFGRLSSLRILLLENNQLWGQIPIQFENLVKLEICDLQNNELDGVIPAELGSLSSLERLRLENNELRGQIPEEFENLTNLTLLYLHANRLSGSVPSQIARLENLSTLWISNNELSGSIPESFTDLARLQSFNFSNTALCEPSSSNYQAWKSGIVNYSGTDVLCNGVPIVENQTFNIAENTANGSIVGVVVASDPDSDELTYSITFGNTGTFGLDASTGALTIADNTQLDFETNPSFSLMVSVDDSNGGTAEATITVNLTDVDENTDPEISDQSFLITENSANGTNIGTVVASDPDSDELTYSITAGNTGNTFGINGATGEINVADNTLLDFDINPSFNLTVRVDDGNSGVSSATITINVDENPVLGLFLSSNVEIGIYPNPAREKFKLMESSPYDEIILVSLDGKITRVLTSEEPSEYDVSKLHAGTYLIYGMYQGRLAELGRLIKQ